MGSLAPIGPGEQLAWDDGEWLCTSAAPDKNAWIRDCEAQSTIYRLVLDDIATVAQLLKRASITGSKAPGEANPDTLNAAAQEIIVVLGGA